MSDLTREKLDRLAIHGGGSVALGCADHPDGGTNVIYQDGAVRVLCRACGFECARVAAASTQPVPGNSGGVAEGAEHRG